MKKRTWIILTFGVLLAGCDNKLSQNDSDKPGAKIGSSPSHASEGPHHGTLIELGKEEYHAELTHDHSKVTVYILDKSAQNPVPIDATELTINLSQDGKPEQHKLTPNPEEKDPQGQSSRFQVESEELVHLLERDTAAPKLNVTIQGKNYRGLIQHSHHGHSH